jgi:hypothetical protein
VAARVGIEHVIPPVAARLRPFTGPDEGEIVGQGPLAVIGIEQSEMRCGDAVANSTSR